MQISDYLFPTRVKLCYFVKTDHRGWSKTRAITFDKHHIGQSHSEPISHFDKVIGLETAATQIPTGLIRSF